MTDWPVEALVGAVRALLTEVDEKFKLVSVGMRGVSCHPGCCNCCYWPVAASPMEGLIVLDHLIESRLWSKALRTKVHEAADQVTGLSYHVWRVANIPCPLLNDGKCMAWEARPIACRVALSQGDPDECHPHKLATATGIIPAAPYLIEFREREAALMRAHGLKITTVPLATAIVIASRMREDGVELVQPLTMIEYMRRIT